MSMKYIMSWVMVMVFGVVPLVRAQAKPAAAAPAVAKPAPVAEKPAPVEAAWNNPLPPGRITVGMHFGDQQAESSGDILVPVLSFKNSLIFINPRGTWNDSDGQEFNLGLGYRHLFPKQDIIVGGNAYYDLRNTSLDNTFNQFGAGVEFLSKWVDARANAYLPETGKKTADSYVVSEGTVQEHGSYWYAPTGQGYQITQYGYDITSVYDVKTLQHYQMFEQAMEGFDCELGALLPIPRVSDYADIKAFVGMYDYNAHYGSDLIGMKGRLEIKPLPSLYLDAAWYEDKALMGSRYSVGVRASLPFDLANLSHGKNPFAGALDGFKPGAKKADFASRMTDMVIRDLHIRTDVSTPEEVVADRRQLEKTLLQSNRKDYNLVLASDVTFVDDDNRSGVENGSWENPYRQINTGVQNAIGTMVYVRDAAQTYYENVVLRDGLTLWGSGAPIYGQGNRYLGGIYPLVDGLGRGPAITLANHVTVAGFEITQSALPTVGFAPNAKPGKPSIDLAGIYGEDVTDVTILHNYI
ncbi:MAG: inverse autotransporter beta domain-containing protein, partial [bacterium]